MLSGLSVQEEVPYYFSCIKSKKTGKIFSKWPKLIALEGNRGIFLRRAMRWRMGV
jgi:hypothetical protein